MKHIPMIIVAITAIAVLAVIFFISNRARPGEVPPHKPVVIQDKKTLEPDANTTEHEPGVIERGHASETTNAPLPEVNSTSDESVAPEEDIDEEGIEEDDYDGEEDDFGC